LTDLQTRGAGLSASTKLHILKFHTQQQQQQQLIILRKQYKDMYVYIYIYIYSSFSYVRMRYIVAGLTGRGRDVQGNAMCSCV